MKPEVGQIRRMGNDVVEVVAVHPRNVVEVVGYKYSGRVAGAHLGPLLSDDEVELVEAGGLGALHSVEPSPHQAEPQPAAMPLERRNIPGAAPPLRDRLIAILWDDVDLVDVPVAEISDDEIVEAVEALLWADDPAYPDTDPDKDFDDEEPDDESDDDEPDDDEPDEPDEPEPEPQPPPAARPARIAGNVSTSAPAPRGDAQAVNNPVSGSGRSAVDNSPTRKPGTARVTTSQPQRRADDGKGAATVTQAAERREVPAIITVTPAASRED